MTRALLKLVLLTAVVIGGGLAVAHYMASTSLDRQLDAARAEVDDLKHAVARLTADRRVAQLLVTDRTVGPDGLPRTTLLMEEYGADDNAPLSPLRFTIVGDEAHLDATVIRFDHGLVEAGDPLRGHSIALFTRIFGDHQTPADAAVVDGPARIGELDRGVDAKVSAFQRSLWAQFWRLAEDPDYRRQMNVAAAGGQGVWFPCKPDRLYTVVLQADGGIGVTSEPLRGIFRDALRGAGH